MAPSRKGNKKKTHPKLKTPNPMSECPLSHPILLNILSRLPVKTLLRCRSVCKPFNTLIRNPKFIQTHLLNYSKSPQNNSFILHTLHPVSYDHFLTLFSQNDENPQTLAHPFPTNFLRMDVVGSINGIVCICKPPWGENILLWNPATRLTKQVNSSSTKPDKSVHEEVSMGFAYDAVKNNYLLISVWCFKRELKLPAKVELYSANTCKWNKCSTECPFLFPMTSTAVTVKGVPYWLAAFHFDLSIFQTAIVFFDIVGEVFRTVLMPDFGIPSGTPKNVELVDLRDKLGVVIFFKVEKFVDVWMMEDDGEMERLSKKFRIGPILGMRSLVGCCRDLEIVGKDGEGKLFVYDRESEGVKYLEIDDEDASELVNYKESLVTFEGATSNEKCSYGMASKCIAQ